MSFLHDPVGGDTSSQRERAPYANAKEHLTKSIRMAGTLAWLESEGAGLRVAWWEDTRALPRSRLWTRIPQRERALYKVNSNGQKATFKSLAESFLKRPKSDLPAMRIDLYGARFLHDLVG